MSSKSPLNGWLLAGAAAGALLLPGPALAQTGSHAELEARVQQLEAALAAVRSELEQQRSANTAQDQSIVRLAQAPAAAAPAAPAQPAEGMRVGNTTLRIGAIVKTEALVSEFADGDVASGTARDFYVPGATPVGGISEDVDLDLHAKQTRLMLTSTTQVDGHRLGAYVEADFQSAPGTEGSERVTNAYNFALRRAYVTYDNWLFGQDWTTFQNVAVLPETTDFIGTTDGTVFGRQMMVRYTHAINDKTKLVFAAENPETTAITTSSATVTGFDDDSLPDLVGRLNWSATGADIAVSGIVRQLSVDGIAGNPAYSQDATGWGVSGSAKVKIGEHDDLRLMVTYGEGIGRYVGLNALPDVVIRANDLETVPVFAGFAAYRHMWGPRTRSTLAYAYQNGDLPVGLLATTTEETWSAFGNLVFSPVRGLDLGVEVRHGERSLLGGQSGELNRLHFVAKQTF